MRNPTRRAALALVTLLRAGTARAAAPTPAPPPPPAAPQGDGPAPAARPSQEEVQASLNAIGAADTRRLLTDRAYAAELLGHLDRIAPYMSDDPAAANAVRTMRLLALATLERPAEGGPIIDQIIEARPNEAGQYAAAWLAALSFRDRPRAVTLIETASRAVPGVRGAELRTLLDRQSVSSLLFQLKTEGRTADRVRFAEALFRIGWPGGGDSESGDFIRSILLDDRLAAGDNMAARNYADGVTSLGTTVLLLLGKRYDVALPAGADRLALLRTAIARQDESTREALSAAPENLMRLVERTNYLRSLARDEEALALLRPHLADVPATAANGEHGMWVINEAASALATLGREDEALALMDRIATLPLAANPSLISLRINHLGMLWEAGRYEEVLRRATALDADAERFASDFGKTWIAATRVCALASLGRGAEAAPFLARLRGWREINPVALSHAYLCLGDDAAAAALMVHRLEAADPDPAIQALQDYALGEVRGPAGALHQRLIALRERPEVRAALERVGRRMTLPLARTYWAEY
jgi:tetratricopeptide (TPR) repeat protein